ncbi:MULTISPECIES: hypothetical protein [Thermus]|uniref:DUF2946 domain-containing protein n=1 Tax=Thermus caliditerrae TaxID=1330700 RepID=A0A7C5VI53_9DEIN|nr:hypothetical protein [Thermus caliditerrae]
MVGRGLGRALAVFLYLALTLTASTGVALQMYLMQVQNPGLRADLCQAPGEEREVDHSLFCGMQVAPSLPVVQEPAAPTLLEVLRVRPSAQAGHPEPARPNLAPRAPPSA